MRTVPPRCLAGGPACRDYSAACRSPCSVSPHRPWIALASPSHRPRIAPLIAAEPRAHRRRDARSEQSSTVTTVGTIERSRLYAVVARNVVNIRELASPARTPGSVPYRTARADPRAERRRRNPAPARPPDDAEPPFRRPGLGPGLGL